MLLTTYECDPEKNVSCPKDCCQKECFATTRLEFAKLDGRWVVDKEKFLARKGSYDDWCESVGGQIEPCSFI